MGECLSFPISNSPVIQPQAKQWVGYGVGVFGAGDEVVFEKF